MEKLLAIIGNDRTLNQEQLNTFIQQEHGGYPPRSWLKRLASVLEELKDGFGFDVVIPAVPITAPRPSILPVKAEEFACLDGCKVLVDTLWCEWFIQQATVQKPCMKEILAFGLACSMASEVGIHSIQIIDALASLRASDVLDGGRLIKLRVHPRDEFKRYSVLALPASARLLLHNLCHWRPNGYLLIDSPNVKRKVRKERTKKMIERNFQSLKKLAASGHPDTRFPADWAAFCRVAHLLPSVLRRYPLPVAHPIESNLPLRRRELGTTPRLSFFQTNFRSTPSSEVGESRRPSVEQDSCRATNGPSGNRKMFMDFEKDWCGRSKTVLRRLVRQIELVGKQKIRTENQKQKAIELIDQALVDANRLAPGCMSALHLALHWTREYIQVHDIKASTVNAYFQRAFINGLLTFGDSYDLSMWGPEDHSLAIESMLDRPRLSEKTKLDIIQVIKNVYSFANRHGYCQGVSISFAVEGWIASSTRPEVIGLHCFDALVQTLLQRKTRHDIEKAAALILGFYGGLRIGEVATLTLDDIVCLEGELHIEIRRSKTAASRRRVPLHLLAPKNACEVVQQAYESRILEFKEKSTSRQLILRDIPLFGPKKLRQQYSGRSLANSCISEIKPFLGSNFGFHSLRHSFASWLLLRWYAARYPDFSDMISENAHPVFGKHCQRNLALLFDSHEPGRIPEYNTSDLVTMAKLMGHSGQETLFSTYVHTLHLIHEHAMQRMSARFGNRKLTGKCISAIVPGMKSRHSHQKLPDRTINGIVSYLNKE